MIIKRSFFAALLGSVLFSAISVSASDCSMAWARLAQQLIQSGSMAEPRGGRNSVTPQGCESLKSMGTQLNQSCPLPQAEDAAQRNLDMANRQYENCKRMFPNNYGFRCGAQVGMCGKATKVLVLVKDISIWSHACQGR